MRTTTTKKLAIGAAAVALTFGGIACSDEDGDGATTDEEVDQVDEQMDDAEETTESMLDDAEDTTESLVDEGEEEIQEGDAETDANDGE